RPRPRTRLLLVGAASRTIGRIRVHQSRAVLTADLHRWRLLLWRWNTVSRLTIALVALIALVHGWHPIARIWLITGVRSITCGHGSRAISDIHRHGTVGPRWNKRDLSLVGHVGSSLDLQDRLQ